MSLAEEEAHRIGTALVCHGLKEQNDLCTPLLKISGCDAWSTDEWILLLSSVTGLATAALARLGELNNLSRWQLAERLPYAQPNTQEEPT